jgi:LPS-assembly lipoprotein
MWWPKPRLTVSRFAPLATALALAGLLGGCFEPLYGEKTLAGGPGLTQRLRTISVEPIKAASGTPTARIAVELQNDLNYNFTGGAGQTGKTHQLTILLTTQNQQVIVDITTARPDVQQFGINVNYILTEVATGKPVVTGTEYARVSYDNPGQQQRFANARGQRDAENRAAKVISEAIKARMASYFAAGT